MIFRIAVKCTMHPERCAPYVHVLKNYKLEIIENVSTIVNNNRYTITSYFLLCSVINRLICVVLKGITFRFSCIFQIQYQYS